MLRDLAEKADRELQELQANLDEGREKDPARQQPLQQRLIDSWQGKVGCPSPQSRVRKKTLLTLRAALKLSP